VKIIKVIKRVVKYSYAAALVISNYFAWAVGINVCAIQSLCPSIMSVNALLTLVSVGIIYITCFMVIK
jgi:hypothetical protein